MDKEVDIWKYVFVLKHSNIHKYIHISPSDYEYLDF